MEKHFFNINVNFIERNKIKELEGDKTKVLFKNSDPIPEGENIKIFQGIISQNFAKGDASRNRYKYKQDGWIFDNYARNPIILWQHNDSYGGIGFTDEIFADSNGNTVGRFYVDLDMLEDRNSKQVDKGFVKMISTGAITLESGFEDVESGEILTEEEAEKKYGWENVWKTLSGYVDTGLTYIVTKAELVENSLVTVGSNYGAIAKSVNSIDDEMKQKADGMQNKRNSQKGENLLFNGLDMTKKVDNAVEEEGVVEVEPQVEETITPEVEPETIETPEPTEVEELQNRVTALEDSFKSYRDEVEKKLDSFTGSLTNSNREEQRNKVLAMVPNGLKTEVNSISDFTKKYFNK